MEDKEGTGNREQGTEVPTFPLSIWSALRRIGRLWAMYARLDLIWITRDLKMFLMWMVADSILSVATITGIWLLSERFGGIGIWNRAQIVFLLGYAATVGALIDMFFGFNVAYISRRLGRGQFDHTLIQPQPVWMALLTDGFAPFSASAMLFPGIGLMAWAGHRLGLHVSPLWLLGLGLSVFASGVVVLSFQFMWGSIAFWAPRSAEEISSSTARLMSQLRVYPLDGLSGILAGSLLTVLPVGFVAWYPCRVLLGLEHAPLAPFVMPVAALLLALLAAWVFGQGRQHYGRVGSQRYSDRGHRG